MSLLTENKKSYDPIEDRLKRLEAEDPFAVPDDDPEPLFQPAGRSQAPAADDEYDPLGDLTRRLRESRAPGGVAVALDVNERAANPDLIPALGAAGPGETSELAVRGFADKRLDAQAKVINDNPILRAAVDDDLYTGAAVSKDLSWFDRATGFVGRSISELLRGPTQEEFEASIESGEFFDSFATHKRVVKGVGVGVVRGSVAFLKGVTDTTEYAGGLLSYGGEVAERGVNSLFNASGQLNPATWLGDWLQWLGRGGSNYLDNEVLKDPIWDDVMGFGGRTTKDDPRMLLDPGYVLYNVGEAAGSMLSGLALGVGGGAAVKALAGPLMRMANPATLIALGGVASKAETLAMGIGGGAVEAGSMFHEMRQEGIDLETSLAASSAFGVFVSGLEWLSMDQIFRSTISRSGWLGRRSEAFKQAADWTISGFTEAMTEYAEQPAQAIIRGWFLREDPEQIQANVINSLKEPDLLISSFILGFGMSVMNTTARANNAAKFAEAQREIQAGAEDVELIRQAPERAIEVLERNELYRQEVRFDANRILELQSQGVDFIGKMRLDQAEIERSAANGQSISVPLSHTIAYLGEDFAKVSEFMRQEKNEFSENDSKNLGEIIDEIRERQDRLFQSIDNDNQLISDARLNFRDNLRAIIESNAMLKNESLLKGGTEEVLDTIFKFIDPIAQTLAASGYNIVDVYNNVSFLNLGNNNGPTGQNVLPQNILSRPELDISLISREGNKVEGNIIYEGKEVTFTYNGIQGAEIWIEIDPVRGISLDTIDDFTQEAHDAIVNFLESQGITEFYRRDPNRPFNPKPGQNQGPGGPPSNQGGPSPQDLLDAQNARGWTEFIGQRAKITLTPKANLTTVIHELTHFVFAQMALVNQSGLATPEFLKDYDTLTKWLDRFNDDANLKDEYDHFQKGRVGKEFDQLSPAELQTARETARQEYFARGMESYLGEGKAPTAGLKGVFRRLKRWFAEAYNNLSKALRVEMNPDVKEVFDRLFQSDQDVDDLVDSVFPTISRELLGAKAANLLEAGKIVAKDALAASRDQNRKSRLNRYKQEAFKIVRNTPPYKMIYDLGKKNQINFANFVAEYGQVLADEIDAKFPKIFDKTTPAIDETLFRGGLLASAQKYKYASAAEFIDALSKLAPEKTAIQDKVAEMENEHDGAYEAIDAVLNAAQFKESIDAIGRILAERLNVQPIDLRLIEYRALFEFEDMKMKGVLSYSKHLADARHNMKMREKTLLRQDFKKAMDYNAKAFYNLEFARLSREFEQQFKNNNSKTNSFIKTNDPYKDVRARHLVMSLATKYGLGLKSANLVGRIQLSEHQDWIDEMKNEGYSFTQDLAQFMAEDQASLLAKGIKSYRDLKFSDYKALMTTINNVMAVANNYSMVKLNNKQVKYETLKTDLIDSIKKNILDPRNIPNKFVEKKGLIQGIKDFAAELHSIRQMCKTLDGGELGPAYNAIYLNIAQADARRTARMTKAMQALRKIYDDSYTAEERIDIFNKPIFINSLGEKVTKENIISVLLNLGNEGNTKTLMESETLGGKKMNSVIVSEMLTHLSVKDTQFAQKIWDFLQTFEKDSFALNERVSGVRPLKVEPRQFDIIIENGQSVTLKGGYYHIAYDADRSPLPSAWETKANIRELIGGLTGNINTRKSHLKARVGPTKQPLNLSFDVFLRQINDTINDIELREALQLTQRLLKDSDVKKAIAKSLGVAKEKMFLPWLSNAVVENRTEYSKLDNILAWARKGVNIFALGFNLSTAFVQLTGLAVTVNEIGIGATLQGFKDVYGPSSLKPWDSIVNINARIDVITGKSQLMRERKGSFDRDITESLKAMTRRLFPQGRNAVARGVNRFSDFIKKSAYAPIIYAQWLVDLTTWQGAYKKGLADGLTEAEAVIKADDVVKTTQSSGRGVDLAPILQGPEWKKMFTMFYTYFGTMFDKHVTTWNEAKRAGKAVKGEATVRSWPSMAILLQFSFWIMVVPALFETGLGALFGKIDDDDDEDSYAAAATKYFGWRMFSAQAAKFPFFRDFVSGFQYSRVPETPSATILKTFYNFGLQFDTDFEEMNLKRLTTSGLQVAGYGAILPTRPLINAINAYWDPSYHWDRYDSELYKAFNVLMR